ncbi:MAG: LysR family transcriptional regulator [Magnetococcales bacterium]|nr:LysR family transcriptional regulator [Magnetococcales bacterium]MBF0632875.1 LysR family transcriptional regulator [Magnetococcales bacterium]
MDRITLMENFVRVVETGSFAEAARKGKISRAAVSKYMVALEEHLAVRLLQRTTRTLHLTTEGEDYYHRCRRILEEIAEAHQAVTHLHATPRGLLRISAPMSFGTIHLAPAVADFLQSHPFIEIELVLNDRLVDLVEEGFDIAMRIGVLQDSSLRARWLAPTRLKACASPAYLQQQGIPEQPEDLARHQCLIYSYSATPNVWRFQQHGPHGTERTVRVRGPLTANNGEVLRAAALTGVGIAILPDFLIDKDLAAQTLVALLPDFALPQPGMYAVYPSSRHLSIKVRRFIDFLVDRFGKGEPPSPSRLISSPPPGWDQTPS